MFSKVYIEELEQLISSAFKNLDENFKFLK